VIEPFRNPRILLPLLIVLLSEWELSLSDGAAAAADAMEAAEVKGSEGERKRAESVYPPSPVD